MMRRSLQAISSRAHQAAEVQKGFKELFSSAAAAAAGRGGSGGAAAASELATPLLVSRATCTQGRSLVPAAVAALAAPARPTGLSSTPCWQWAAARGYAQLGTKMPLSGYKPPPEMQRAMQMRLSMVSSNLLAEPYRGAPPPLPASAYFTLSGWKELWRRFLSQAKSLYTLSKCKKGIPGFDRKEFKGEALSLYKEICNMLAQGDKTALRQLVTPAVFSDMKRQLKQREDGGWARVQWELVREPAPEDLVTVHGRLIMLDPKDDSSGVAQLTVRIPSAQRFAAYDSRGRLVAGSAEQPIEVEDFWVFEHALKKSAANRWRLAGRLSILPHAVEQRQQPSGAAAEQGQQQQKQASQQQQQQQQPEEAEIRVGHVAAQQQQQAYQPWGQQKGAAKQKQAAAKQAAGGRGRR